MRVCVCVCLVRRVWTQVRRKGRRSQVPSHQLLLPLPARGRRRCPCPPLGCLHAHVSAECQKLGSVHCALQCGRIGKPHSSHVTAGSGHIARLSLITQGWGRKYTILYFKHRILSFLLLSLIFLMFIFRKVKQYFILKSTFSVIFFVSHDFLPSISLGHILQIAPQVPLLPSLLQISAGGLPAFYLKNGKTLYMLVLIYTLMKFMKYMCDIVHDTFHTSLPKIAAWLVVACV